VAADKVGIVQILDRINKIYGSPGERGSLRESYRLPSLLSGDPTASYYTPLNSPAGIASAVGYGALAGDIPLGGLGMLIAAERTAIASRGEKYQADLIKEELGKRSRILAGLVGDSVGPALTRVAPWAWADQQNDTPGKSDKHPFDVAPLAPFLPMTALAHQIHEQLEKTLALNLEFEEIADFLKKMKDAQGDSEKASNIVSDSISKLKMQNVTGASTQEDDRYSIDKDPGLSPLREAYLAQRNRANKPFALEFFEAERGKGSGPTYQVAEVMVGDEKPDPMERTVFLYWKTRNVPARVPNLDETIDPSTGETVRDQVRNAWLTMEARKLARKQAEKEAETLRELGPTFRTLATLLPPRAAQRAVEEILQPGPRRGKPIWLDKLSRLEKPTIAREGLSLYLPYKVPEDAVPYPSSGFVDDLLKLADGQSDVLRDNPERTYYAAYVVRRESTPTVDEALKQETRSGLWDLLQEKQRTRSKKAIIEELRRQAADKGVLDSTGHFMLNPNVIKGDRNTSTED
jgi:hypothetical protein